MCLCKLFIINVDVKDLKTRMLLTNTRQNTQLYLAIIEFAGVKFKTKSIIGLAYIKSVKEDYIAGTRSILPNASHLVLVEETALLHLTI